MPAQWVISACLYFLINIIVLFCIIPFCCSPINVLVLLLRNVLILRLEKRYRSLKNAFNALNTVNVFLCVESS